MPFNSVQSKQSRDRIGGIMAASSPSRQRPLGYLDSDDLCCPTCGVQTHMIQQKRVKISNTEGGPPLSAVVMNKEPLTIDNVVSHGQCLRCEFNPSDMFGFAEAVSYHHAANRIVRRHSPPREVQQASFGTTIPRNHDGPHVINQDLGSSSHSSSGSRTPVKNGTENDDGGEILSILLQISHNPFDLHLQVSSFHKLRALSYETDQARAIGLLGGIPIMLSVLQQHLHFHVNITQRYNRNNTSHPSAIHRMNLFENGLVAFMNLSMNQHLRELFAERAEGEIQVDAADGDSPAQVSGISLITLLLSSFTHSSEVVTSGCNALTNILSCRACYTRVVANSDRILRTVRRCAEHHSFHPNCGAARAARRCLCVLEQSARDESAGLKRKFHDIEGGSCKLLY